MSNSNYIIDIGHHPTPKLQCDFGYDCVDLSCCWMKEGIGFGVCWRGRFVGWDGMGWDRKMGGEGLRREMRVAGWLECIPCYANDKWCDWHYAVGGICDRLRWVQIIPHLIGTNKCLGFCGDFCQVIYWWTEVVGAVGRRLEACNTLVLGTVFCQLQSH